VSVVKTKIRIKIMAAASTIMARLAGCARAFQSRCQPDRKRGSRQHVSGLQNLAFSIALLTALGSAYHSVPWALF
jgi:hypothetical protein